MSDRVVKVPSSPFEGKTTLIYSVNYNPGLQCDVDTQHFPNLKFDNIFLNLKFEIAHGSNVIIR